MNFFLSLKYGIHSESSADNVGLNTQKNGEKKRKLDFRVKLIKTFPKTNEQQTRRTEEKKPPLKHMLKAASDERKEKDENKIMKN